MTPEEFIDALRTAGIPGNIGMLEFDRQASSLLAIDPRTVRRYRLGEPIPGIVAVAVTALAKSATASQSPPKPL